MESKKKIVDVYINEEGIHFTNDPRNVTVCPVGYEPGDPIGNGAKRKEAIEKFIESWMDKYDEEIEVFERV